MKYIKTKKFFDIAFDTKHKIIDKKPKFVSNVGVGNKQEKIYIRECEIRIKGIKCRV